MGGEAIEVDTMAVYGVYHTTRPATKGAGAYLKFKAGVLQYELTIGEVVEDESELARISHRMARLSRRALDLQEIFRTGGITVCIAEFRKLPVDSKNKRESVIPVRNAG